MLLSSLFHGSMILLRLPVSLISLARLLPLFSSNSPPPLPSVLLCDLSLKAFAMWVLGYSHIYFHRTHTFHRQTLGFACERETLSFWARYHLWYVFPCVCKIFPAVGFLHVGGCVWHGKPVEVRVQPWGLVLICRGHEAHATTESTRETRIVRHAAFLHIDACSPGRLEQILFNYLMTCYCFPQTPKHCFLSQ